VTGAILGLAALDGLLFLSGLGVLRGAGLVHSLRDGLRLSGLAFVLGWAFVGILGSLALMVGLAFDGAQVVLACLVLGAAGAVAGRRVRPAPPPAAGSGWSGSPWLAVAGVAALLVVAVALLRRALVAPGATAWDSWAFWLPKARSLVLFDGIDTATGGFTSFAHPAYPPLVPAMEAAAFRFSGTLDASGPLLVQHWLFAVAFLAALGGLFAGRVSPPVLWPSLALIALMPYFGRLVGSSLGDEPLFLVVGLAGACAALWLLERDPRYAALCAGLLGAAALAKGEGLMLSILLGFAVLCATLVQRPFAWRVPAVIVGSPIAVSLAWRGWLATHDLPGWEDYRPTDLLRPGYLADRLDRLGTAVVDLPAYVLEPDRWLLAVPLALAAAVLAARRAPGLTALVLSFVAVGFVGIATIYWISPLPLAWYIDTSAERVVGSLVFFCASVFPLLLAAALGPEKDGAV